MNQSSLIEPTLTGQKARLINHIRKHGRITRLIAFKMCGIFELSANVVYLERMGYVFEKEPRRGTNRFGEGFNFKVYRLIGYFPKR